MKINLSIFLVVLMVILGCFFLSHSRLGLATQDVRAYFDEGMKYTEDENYDKAIESFRKAIRQNPGIPQLYNALGYVLLKKNGTVKSASRAFQKAIDLDPHYADPYFNLGTYYAGTAQDPILASDYFEKAIKADPTYAKAYMGLGWISLEKKNAKKATEYFEKAVQYEPNLPESQYGLAVSYMALKKNELALKPITLLRAMNRNELAQAVEDKMHEQEPPPLPTGDFGAGGASGGAAGAGQGSGQAGAPPAAQQQALTPQQQLGMLFGGGKQGK